MAAQTRFGFAHTGLEPQTAQFVVAAADSYAYAIGDPVRSTGVVARGRLPNGAYTEGLLVVTRAVSGRPVRGIIVGIEKDEETAGAVVIPAEKTRDYLVSVRDAGNAVFAIQCNNTAPITSLSAGSRAVFAPGDPNGSVSGFYIDAAKFGDNGDLSVVGIASNLGANSTVLVSFINTETRPVTKDWVDVTPPITLTASDAWSLWRLTTAGTITIPEGLVPPPTLAIIPPASGDLTISVTGAATANADTADITRDRATNPGGIAIVPYGGNNYGVSGC